MNKKENILNRLYNRLCFSGAYLLVILTIIGVMLSCFRGIGGLDPEPTPTTKPNAVTDLAIKGDPGSTEITITWARPTGTTYYKVTKQKENGTVERVEDKLITDNTEFTITELDSETSYTFSLWACNDAGCSEEAATVDGTTVAIEEPPLNAPGNLKYSPEVGLEWTAVTRATYYPVFYTNMTSGGPEVSNYVANDNKFATTGLTANTEYSFSVQACNQFGCSSRSEPHSITTPPGGGLDPEPTPTTKPNAVTGLAIKGDPGSTEITITWVRPTGTTYYKVTKQKENGTVERVEDKLITDDTEFAIGDLTSETTYTFAIQACNQLGCSDPETVKGTTGEITEPPANAPSNLKYSSAVGLEWTAVTRTAYYLVFYTNITSGGPEVPNYVTDNKFATADEALTGNMEYSFSVQACNDFGCSSRSEPHSIITPPGAPEVTKRDVGTNSVTLNWDKIDGVAIRYEIYRNGNLITTIEDVDAITYTDTNLEFDTDYEFYVKACNSEFCSEQSSLIEVRTLSLATAEFFTISYPKMDSFVGNFAPVIVGGKDCALDTLTARGSATYTISALSDGSRVVPTINSANGVVNNGVASPGVYKVEVKVDSRPACHTNLLIYNTIKPANLDALKAHIFDGTSSGVALHGNEGNFNYIDTSGITSMSSLFYEKTSFNGDITEWDTSKVWNMRDTFGDTEKFNRDISKWDTSQVTVMVTMFAGATAFYQNISGWNVDKVTQHGFIFYQSAMANKKEWWPPKFR